MIDFINENLIKTTEMNQKISDAMNQMGELDRQLNESNHRCEQVSIELRERSEERDRLMEELERERSSSAEYKSRFESLERELQEKVKYGK